MDLKRARQVLWEYEQKVRHPDYVKRKRGNPEDVREAALLLVGGWDWHDYEAGLVVCSACNNFIKRIYRVQPCLHHINEVWRDYSPKNLTWLHRSCHNHFHSNGGSKMAKVGRTPLTQVILENREQLLNLKEARNWQPAASWIRKNHPNVVKGFHDKFIRETLGRVLVRGEKNDSDSAMKLTPAELKAFVALQRMGFSW